jgi:hypothetical protein
VTSSEHHSQRPIQERWTANHWLIVAKWIAPLLLRPTDKVGLKNATTVKSSQELFSEVGKCDREELFTFRVHSPIDNRNVVDGTAEVGQVQPAYYRRLGCCGCAFVHKIIVDSTPELTSAFHIIRPFQGLGDAAM